MNLPYARNDREETEIRTSGAFAAAYQFSDPLEDIASYHDIDFYIEVTDKGTNNSVTVKAQSSSQNAPASVWSDVKSDDAINSGAVTLATYEATYDISGETAPFRLHLNMPRRGLHMRLGIKGIAADGAFSVSALKNVR